MARWRVTVDVTLIGWGYVDVVADTEDEAMVKAADVGELNDDPIISCMPEVVPTEAENLDE